MSCDICGEEIFARPAKVIVEGAVLEVCPRCAHLGKPYVPPPRTAISQLQSRPRSVRRESSPSKRVSASLPRTYEEFDVIENFGKKIRSAREHRGMTQAELAASVKERVSIIQKIELEKMTPNTDLCMTLEHVLRITLLTPRKEIPTTGADVGKTGELTLGDIAQLKRKN